MIKISLDEKIPYYLYTTPIYCAGCRRTGFGYQEKVQKGIEKTIELLGAVNLVGIDVKELMDKLCESLENCVNTTGRTIACDSRKLKELYAKIRASTRSFLENKNRN